MHITNKMPLAVAVLTQVRCSVKISKHCSLSAMITLTMFYKMTNYVIDSAHSAELDWI